MCLHQIADPLLPILLQRERKNAHDRQGRILSKTECSSKKRPPHESKSKQVDARVCLTFWAAPLDEDLPIDIPCIILNTQETLKRRLRLARGF